MNKSSEIQTAINSESKITASSKQTSEEIQVLSDDEVLSASGAGKQQYGGASKKSNPSWTPIL